MQRGILATMLHSPYYWEYFAAGDQKGNFFNLLCSLYYITGNKFWPVRTLVIFIY